MTLRELIAKVILDIHASTGISATGGIGTNLYLCKVAMDIGAKHAAPDRNGVRIAVLDELSYRRSLWDHRPITDFWRVGRGYAKKLEQHGMYTMGDVARCSVGKASDYHNEALLYKLFGVNAELLIDHAWGWEPCDMPHVKAYKSDARSMGPSQVLPRPYTHGETKLIVQEMTESLSYDLVEKGLLTNQLVLTIGYDRQSLEDPKRKKNYHGSITTDPYGRSIPKHAHGTANLGRHMSSTRLMQKAATELFERISDKNLLSRRVSITANHVIDEADTAKEAGFEQLDLFTDYGAAQTKEAEDAAMLEREKRKQRAVLDIQKKLGKDAVISGNSLMEGGTTILRNNQIGGHRK